MRVTTAMLADAAQVQRGKLYVLGGGFSTITVRSLPAVHPAMSLVLMVEVGAEEWGQNLDLRISLFDEDGYELGVGAQGRLLVRQSANLRPGESGVVPLVGNFVNLKLPEAKGYAFVVTHDDKELARVRFRVLEAATPEE